MKKEELAKYIDHTLLKVDVDYANLKNLCAEAIKYNFASVAVFPSNIELCAKMLEGTDVKVCAALAFPLGSMTPEAKAFETRDAVAKGAKELDIVVNVGAIKSKRWDVVKKEIELFKEAAGDNISKVILECCFLTDEEKIKVCELAAEIGVSFVKTSTGLFDGATVEDVALMKKAVKNRVQVKAAGGIRTAAQAKALIQAGATRLGCSSGVKIFEEWEE